MKLSRDQKRAKKLTKRRLAGRARNGQHRRMIDISAMTPAARKVREALEAEGLRIYCKVVNNRLDYSLAGPPGYEVASEWLSVALVEGVLNLKRMPHPSIAEKRFQSDGREIVYDTMIRYDFANGLLFSGIEDEDTLRHVIAFIAQDLHREAAAGIARKAGLC